MDLRDCDQICEYCRVRLPFPRKPPAIIEGLFGDKKFMENICVYNQMFAMTSFGARVDDSINNGSGTYVFRVEGQISHWMGSLCPPKDTNPRFLQMYIYDIDNEVCNRLHHFGANQARDLSPEIARILILFFFLMNLMI